MTVKRYDVKDISGGISIRQCDAGRYVSHADYAELQRKVEALAVESSQVKAMNDCLSEQLREYESDGAFEGPNMHLIWWNTETPATDAALAEIRAQARAEGINFAASRLAAAFNHGFVEKPVSEVFDVTKMILDTKAVLVNDQNIPSDGLSGEYAELALKQWEQQLRKESGQ